MEVAPPSLGDRFPSRLRTAVIGVTAAGRLLLTLLLLAGVLLLVAVVRQADAGAHELTGGRPAAGGPAAGTPAAGARGRVTAGRSRPVRTPLGRYEAAVAQAAGLSDRLAQQPRALPVPHGTGTAGAASTRRPAPASGRRPPGTTGDTAPRLAHAGWRPARLRAEPAHRRAAAPGSRGAPRPPGGGTKAPARSRGAGQGVLAPAPARPEEGPHQIGLPEPIDMSRILAGRRVVWIGDDHGSLQMREQLPLLLAQLRQAGFTDLLLEGLSHDRRDVDPADSAAVLRFMKRTVEELQPGLIAANHRVYESARKLGFNVSGLELPRRRLAGLLHRISAALPGKRKDRDKIFAHSAPRRDQHFAETVARLAADPRRKIAILVGFGHLGYWSVETANTLLAKKGIPSAVVQTYHSDLTKFWYSAAQDVMLLATEMMPDSFMLGMSGSRNWDYLIRYGPGPPRTAAGGQARPAREPLDQTIARERALKLLERLVTGLNQDFQHRRTFSGGGEVVRVDYHGKLVQRYLETVNKLKEPLRPVFDPPAPSWPPPMPVPGPRWDPQRDGALQPDAETGPEGGQRPDQPATTTARTTTAAASPRALAGRPPAGTAGTRPAGGARGFTLGIESAQGASFVYADGALTLLEPTDIEGVHVEAGTVIDRDRNVIAPGGTVLGPLGQLAAGQPAVVRDTDQAGATAAPGPAGQPALPPSTPSDTTAPVPETVTGALDGGDRTAAAGGSDGDPLGNEFGDVPGGYGFGGTG
ncbi:MAG TPA: hypothetical protein VKG45_11800 [Actinomycetes bacterium]|nr:hypothetical protein [Actinomycetes bacterium]